MTLRRKMAYQITAMIVGLALIGAAALWGILSLHHDFGSAISAYQGLRSAYERSLQVSITSNEELRKVYEVSSRIATARIILSAERPDENLAMREIQLAHSEFKQLFPTVSPDGSPSPKEKLLADTRRALDEADAAVNAAATSQPGQGAKLLSVPINHILAHVANLESEIRKQIRDSQAAAESTRQAAIQAMAQHQRAADEKRHAIIVIISVLVGVVIAVGIALGVLEYRSVTSPLGVLSEGVRRIAGGDLSHRIAPEGHAEFVALAKDFNRMTDELDGLYRELERKVAEKSKHLVRSERLASVGFLAAGVAHEINNPIGIIAGYAEFTLEQLGKNVGSQSVEEARKALGLIAEEAFRCKQIVQQLLSLSRGGEETRRVISLEDVAADVVAIVGGLRDYRDRQIRLDAQNGGSLNVLAAEGEMKQVILNLTLNAIEAIELPPGSVDIVVRRDGGWVELSVSDSGRGMSPEVMERVFEPFFTAKRGSSRPGTGLGLSITHAIVENHGGEIRAYSNGPGQGSRFVVRLPAT